MGDAIVFHAATYSLIEAAAVGPMSFNGGTGLPVARRWGGDGGIFNRRRQTNCQEPRESACTKRVRWGSVTKPTAAASDRVTAGATLPWEEAAGRRPVAGDQHKYRSRPLNDLSFHTRRRLYLCVADRHSRNASVAMLCFRSENPHIYCYQSAFRPPLHYSST